jgi:hypothetical protein
MGFFNKSYVVVSDSKEGFVRLREGLTKKKAKSYANDILDRKKMVKAFGIKNVRIVKERRK